jgi:prevent-host-death family protein
MVRIINVWDAKTHLSRLLADVANGEEIIIAKAGEPVARLAPVQAVGREIGFARHQVVIAEEAFTE